MRQYPLCCGNSKCQTSQTPLWRKGWVTPEGKTIMLCNACGLHYKKGHYCMYCNQIYRESDADDHSNPWIGCDRCSRWVHQKCEEQNGHEIKKQKSYLCPDCRCVGITQDASASSVGPATSSNPGTQMAKTPAGKGSGPSVIKKRRKTPSGSRGDSPDCPTPLLLPHHRVAHLSPATPTSPISPGSNFVLFAQHHLDKKQNSTPTTPNSLFDPNNNVMPCWAQLKNSIQNLPSTPTSPVMPAVNKKRKANPSVALDSTTMTKKQKKNRTTTTITTTTTHHVNSAGIDALMGAVVAEQNKQTESVPQLDLKITVKKGKQTSRKMNADARTAAIASSTDTPSTPTLFTPPMFATTTTTTTTTTVVPSSAVDDAAKSSVSLSEEQFYQYQQLILQQQNGHTSFKEHDDGELSNDSISSGSSTTAASPARPPITLLQNTFGSVDKLGNFYGSFNEQEQKPEASPYGMMDDDEDYVAVMPDKRRPQKRTRRSPKNVTTTTTVTMTTTVMAPTKSKRLRERMAKNGGVRPVYASSSETEESDYDPAQDEQTTRRWEKAAKALNISLEDAHSVLTTRFPKAPVLKKMGSLWAICEVIRCQDTRS